MEPSDLLNIEQQSFTLSENVKKLINNRTENLTRLGEQRKNCYTEMKAFRNDLNKFLDKIENEFFNELAMLEREQRDKIQNAVWELGNIIKEVEHLKMQLKEIVNCVSSKKMNQSKINTLQQIKRSLSENELNVYAKCNTSTDGNGWKEIDLNMSPDPALQIITSKIKSMGEVFITTCPVIIALDGKKPVVEDVEMTEENTPENEDKEEEKEKEAPTSIDLLTSTNMKSRAHSAQSAVKATNIDLKTLVTKKSIIQTWPERERYKASKEKNFFNTVIRNVVEATGLRSIRGDNSNTLFSKVKQWIPNLSLEDKHVERFYKKTLINFIYYKRKREQDYNAGGHKNPRSIHPSDVLQYDGEETLALLKSGTDVCLSDGVSPVAKAKITHYPAMELGMKKDQQREFASVQILLKKRNTDVPKLPFLDDIRSWKDIGRGSKLSWRITDIRPIDCYDKYMKQANVHRKRGKRQAVKGPSQPEPDNIDQKPINQTSEPQYNTPVNHPTESEGSDVQEPTYVEPINQDSNSGAGKNPRRSIYPTDVVHFALLKSGTNVCLCDGELPIAKAKIIYYPDINLGLTEDKQREFASTQILLKRSDTDVPKLPFLDEIRSWKDIGRGSKVSWRITNIRPLDYYDKYIKQGDLHRRSIARKVKKQSEKCSNQPEPDNIDQKAINQTSVICEPLYNTPGNHPTDSEGCDVQEPTYLEIINLSNQEFYYEEVVYQEPVNHEPVNNTPVNHPADNEGFDDQEPKKPKLNPLSKKVTTEDSVKI